MLVLTRQRDQTIMIGDDIEVTIVDIRGDKVRLGITAPKEISVHRKEVYDAIRKENQQAAQVTPQDLPIDKLKPRNTIKSLSSLLASQDQSGFIPAGEPLHRAIQTARIANLPELELSINSWLNQSNPTAPDRPKILSTLLALIALFRAYDEDKVLWRLAADQALSAISASIGQPVPVILNFVRQTP